MPREEVAWLNCAKCGTITPHKEDAVPDSDAAAVWHCLYCGEEKRPKGGNAPVPA